MNGKNVIVAFGDSITQGITATGTAAAYLKNEANCSLEIFVQKVREISKSTGTQLIDVCQKVIEEDDYKTAIIPEGYLPGALGSPFIAEILLIFFREKLSSTR